MKAWLFIACWYIAAPTWAEHSLFFGLYSDHYGYKKYRDYGASEGRFSDTKPLNQGGPKASKLFGYLYSRPGYAVGACSFRNSFYERTYCLLGLLKYTATKNITLETGLNLTYGYRPALIMQMASLSMSKQILPIPIVGITFDYKKSAISYNYMAPGVSTLIFRWKL